MGRIQLPCESDIQRSIHKGLGLLGRHQFRNIDADSGMAFAEVAHDGWHQTARSPVEESDVECSDFSAKGALRHFYGAVGAFQNFANFIQEDLAVRSQRDFLPAPDE